MTISQLLPSLLAIVLALMLSACVTWAIRPLLQRYALARPNARSSHRIPTPQGAGIAVIGATLLVAGGIIACSGLAELRTPAIVFAATLFIALVGAVDDIKPIPVLARLILQALAVSAVLSTVPDNFRIIPACPFWVESGLRLLAGLWFVNLVNFMDGLDWMTVAEVVPLTAALVLLGLLGELSSSATIVAAALGGAMAGFAPFNRPVAKVFLGDVGSLPIGLLLGWCLLELVQRQHFAAALLLPLYYLADATVTLFRRVARREQFWNAHRSHFYQRATDNGFPVLRVVSEVFGLNIGLALLAVVSTMTQSAAVETLLLAVAGLAVALQLHRFSRRS